MKILEALEHILKVIKLNFLFILYFVKFCDDLHAIYFERNIKTS